MFSRGNRTKKMLFLFVYTAILAEPIGFGVSIYINDQGKKVGVF